MVRGQFQPHQETCQEHDGTEKKQRQRQFERLVIINGPEPVCIPDHFAIKAAFHDHAVIDEAAVISLCPVSKVVLCIGGSNIHNPVDDAITCIRDSFIPGLRWILNRFSRLYNDAMKLLGVRRTVVETVSLTGVRPLPEGDDGGRNAGSVVVEGCAPGFC